MEKNNYTSKHFVVTVIVSVLIVSSFYVFKWFQGEQTNSGVNNYKCNINDIKENSKYIKTFDEALYLVKLHCGEPDTEIGSGLYIPLWNLNANTSITLLKQGLIYNKNGNEENLIASSNYLIDNIFGDYEVSYFDAENQQYIWMGTLRLSSDMRYRYYELSKFSDEIQNKIKELFLMANPVGDFNFKIQDNYNKTDRLEFINDDSFVAELTLSRGNKNFAQLLMIDKQNRRISFHSTVSEISLVGIGKAWENNFYAPNIQRNDYELTIPDVYMNYDSHGTPVSLDADKELLNDVQFHDSSENVIFSLHEVSKISEPYLPDAESRNKYLENKMKVFLPQSSKMFVMNK